MDKSMKFESSLSKSEIKSKLKQAIKKCDRPTDFKAIAFLPVEIQGNVTGDSFWLQHTRPHSRGIPQRYFKGSIEQQGNVSVIKGGYKYTLSFKVASIIFIAILIIISLVRYVGNVQYPFIPLWLALFPIIASGISPIYFERDEAIVTAFLKTVTNDDCA